MFTLPILSFAALQFCGSILGQDQSETSLEKVYSTDFSGAESEWEFVDKGWRFFKSDEGQVVLSQHLKENDYQPPFRSPRHMALLKEVHVTDFEINVKVKSTHADYGHRDVCLFFGYQSDSEFYYVHLGQRTDDHANQIFIVNKAARTKISSKTTDGTPWDDEWHDVKITRQATSGEIRVYFDDMESPVMEATDKTFGWGQVGLGSFDDTADWDDFSLLGETYEADK